MARANLDGAAAIDICAPWPCQANVNRLNRMGSAGLLRNARHSESSKVDPRDIQRVLIADDNQDAALSLGMILSLEGHEARVVCNGAEALAMGEAFRPHLIVLDIGMPVLDGYSAAVRIRQTSWGRTVHLVALTGWGQEADRRKAMAAGFDDHLVKPAEPDVICALIKRLALGL